MKYLSDNHLREIGIDWQTIIGDIQSAVGVIGKGAYAQPIKPYLRYNNRKNRIIAMPAYISNPFDIAGIKWISSFPDNIRNGLPRAHAVTILNEADTGRPVCIINTPLLSGIRTASVSGYMLKLYFEALKQQKEAVTLGIIGFGPIGRLHLDMAMSIYGQLISQVIVYDINKIDLRSLQGLPYAEKILVAEDWRAVFNRSDILATCTVSDTRYIDFAPKKGALYLNISLRDFDVNFVKNVDVVIVDSWEEVCREDTDIERAHKAAGINKENVKEITELEDNNVLQGAQSLSVMFNPMGMAVFDIVVAHHYFNFSLRKDIGVNL